MKTILRAALALSLLALPSGASAGDAADENLPVEGAAAAPTAADEGEDEGEDEDAAGAAAQPGVEQPETEALRASPDLPAQVAGLRAAAQAQARIVGGAPLGNANVHVHIVEKKPYTNAGRHELVLYPAIAQLNSRFTTHVGAVATYGYHVFENLSIQVSPLFQYVNRESAFNQELIEKMKLQAEAATALLLEYGAVAGIEVTPMYGKFAFYEGVLGHFTFVLNAGAGIADTRVQLSDAQTSGCGGTGQPVCDEAAFGDTGLKFLGSVGAGLRIFLGERAAVRLEVRDLIYTASVDRINGCTFADLEALDAGQLPSSATCDSGSFASRSDPTGKDGWGDAKSLLEKTSSDVLNNVFFFTGFSFLF